MGFSFPVCSFPRVRLVLVSSSRSASELNRAPRHLSEQMPVIGMPFTMLLISRELSHIFMTSVFSHLSSLPCHMEHHNEFL